MALLRIRTKYRVIAWRVVGISALAPVVVALSCQRALADPNPCTVSASSPYTVTCTSSPPTVIPPINVNVSGGNGGNGSDGGAFIPPGSGGTGGAGADETLIFPTLGGSQAIELPSPPAAIFVESAGGTGGSGGSVGAYLFGGAADGGQGGNGGVLNVTVNANLPLATQQDQTPGIWVESVGGLGGSGGNSYGSILGGGGAGGAGGVGQNVTVSAFNAITTIGQGSYGILAESLGGGGGAGGAGYVSTGGGGSGGQAQAAGTVNVNLGLSGGGDPGTIMTYGADADGILAQSVGGFGGKGGGGFVQISPVTFGGDGQDGGPGNTVTVTTSSDSTIETMGDRAAGILAQSLGGGGGAGGLGGSLFGAGGSGAPGGIGGDVFVTNGATITTYGAAAKGIFAQSVGGGGGDGGSAGGIVSLGGQGSTTSNGGTVTVINTGNITTNSNQSLSATSDAVEFGTQAIFAQSVGGGGGNGGSSGGLVSIGGAGGGGGNGGVVAVTNAGGTLVTNASQSDAIFAQSVGGGGGNGGGSAAVGLLLSAAVGGSGGMGGTGSDTSVTANGGSITTNGSFSNGIQAQSVGGGGGNGGFAFSASVGISSTSLGVGGSGGTGGNGSTVEVTNGDPAIAQDFGTSITTTGANSNGIFAQSVGGGGGSGGFSVAAGLGLVDSLGISVGGKGGVAGSGETVTVKNNATVQTSGNGSEGVFAQSVGGGGGVGNFGVSGNVSVGAAAGFSFGGSGGAAGSGGTVLLTNGGTVTTTQGSADALEAQSVGGGGGQGGMSVTGGVALAHLGMSLGGNGGGGGNGGTVTLTNSGALTTMGDSSDALLAQSLAGGGGNGAFSVSAGLSAAGMGVSIGGSGGSGGTGGTVTATNLGRIITMGKNAEGIFAQSVAGGGGNGGFSVAGDVTGAGGLDVSVGGGGGSGGAGGDVTVNNGMQGENADVMTAGTGATGIEAQSLGGGGGNGAFSVGATTGLAGGLDIGIGGSGGSASTAGTVTVTNFGNISTGAGTTTADGADAILAQSIAGGGGKGAFGVAAGAAIGVPITVAVGGNGGSGGSAGTVIVNTTGVLSTNGDNADGILAQSSGGGGGKGGFDASGGLSLVGSLGLGVGGSGGAGGLGGFVSVNNTGGITTTGNDSDAISAQSNGGGGGSATFSAAGGVSAGVSATLSLGGSGGKGGSSDGVDVFSSAGVGSCTGGGNPAVGRQCPPTIGTITTNGDRSDGINAQSSGGSGGTGGMSIAGSALTTVSLDASIGGSGGDGGQAGSVFVQAADNITTHGDAADGINAQSQGGGGGAGGFSVAGSVTTFLTPPVGTANLSIGGAGGNGGATGQTVTVENYGAIQTTGTNANAIFAQSQGGTGGSGGFSVAGALDAGFTPSLDVAVGGSGGNGSQSNTVFVSNLGALTTTNNNADGISAESEGGGGGKAGLNVAGGITGSVALQLGIGGSGGDGSTSGEVTVDNGSPTALTTIHTSGSQSDGIFAESVGGNGGSGSISIAGGVAIGATLQLSVGGNGGTGATSGVVEVTDFGNIITGGPQSNGIHAESVGGNGGNGGISVAGGVSPITSGSLSIGGAGESGANANTATVNFGSISGGQFGGTIVTTAAQSNGIEVQSIGGGGGSGGFSVAGSVTLLPSANLSLGGTGGDAGNGSTATVNAFGDIGTKDDSSDGILAQSIGGGGGNGGFSVSGALSLTSSLPLSIGGRGGDGGRGGNVNVTSVGVIGTSGNDSSAIVAQSIGGGGGNGGFSVAGDITDSSAQGSTVGGVAGFGARAGIVTVVDLNASTAAKAPTIFTLGNQSDGILAQSTGGSGGQGGFSVGGSINNGSTTISSVGGLGGAGSIGGNVGVANNATIFTQGRQSDGIAAQSIGGGGGGGGFSVAGSFSSGKATDSSIGGLGGAAGRGGVVLVENTARSVITLGVESTGVYAESIGGGGGTGGFSIAGALTIGSDGAANSLGGLGGGGGNAGWVIITNGPLRKGAPNFVGTAGNQSDGILAQSVGGGGGEGGFAIAGTISNAEGLSQALGGDGEGAGSGAAAFVLANTDVLTSGNQSDGIVAQSIGGGGGSGGWTVGGGLSLGGGPLDLAMGGVGGGGGNGNTAIVVSAADAGIETTGAQSDGLLAQSIGGGGGSGGFSIAGAITTGYTVGFSMGGRGGGAGTGGIAGVGNASTIVTTGIQSDGVVAQSIGGGGGDGGFAISGSGSVGLAGNTSFGGDASGGNNGGTAIVVNAGDIATRGEGADAILAQSAGGGGGDGGFSIAGSATLKRGASFSFGGSGAAGGDAGNATVVNTAAILFTRGANANALEAQSLGGGGGDGGFSIGGGITAKGTLDFSFGGSATTGGDGGAVVVTSGTTSVTEILTTGNNANGILAQTIGGGGGSGGFAIAGGINGGLGIDEAFGGQGGGGGDGGSIYLLNSSLIHTSGTSSAAIAAQSIGGGGGDGGFSIAGSLSGDNGETLSLGGGAGAGGRGGQLYVQNESPFLETTGNLSDGILAQGIGGGGGAGGFSITAAGSLGSRAIGTSLGGNGGSGGVGGAPYVVSGAVNTTTTIVTTGAESDGILEQSIGGGGGSGGFSVESLASEGSTFGISVGGTGGTGNNAGGSDVGTRLLNYSNIGTSGAASNGILVQSIGGGGGSAGFNVTAKVAADNTGFSVAGAFGFGSGGSGGNGEVASVVNHGLVFTTGNDANGVVAQSIGGGGGYGGFSFATQLRGNLGLNEGATNDGGGNGGRVDLGNTQIVITRGDNADDLVAQSIGGGGGDAGFSISGNVATTGSSLSGVDVALGNDGGAGGNGGSVTISSTSAGLETSGTNSDAVLAQSIGGGGGNGGFAIAADVSTSYGNGLTLGGSGGGGGTGGTVGVGNSSVIITNGAFSDGIAGQSIGGGGGNGGFAIGGTVAFGLQSDVVFGGSGGTGNDGGAVTLINTAAIGTKGTGSDGILGESIGGGGGNGGFSIDAAVTQSATKTLSFGGLGGASGNGGNVGIGNTGTEILTTGADAAALAGESIGGGGGTGAFAVDGSFSGGLVLSFGGAGGGGGDGGTVVVVSGNAKGAATLLRTSGFNAAGIVAQSVGGGGGEGGLAIDAPSTATPRITFGVGGIAGGFGNGGNAIAVNYSRIATTGTFSDDILAQSVGGGGGAGSVDLTGAANATVPTAVHVGATFGSGGSGALAGVGNDKELTTTGAGAYGIAAQSIGDGGGMAGFADAGNLAWSTDGGLAIGSTGGPCSDDNAVELRCGRGDGGVIAVANAGTIITTNTAADATLGQSIGGGGGAAALLVGGSADGKGPFGIALGGLDVAGAGGAVGANNVATGVLGTRGFHADGMQFQSIGGGGGTGTIAITGGISANALAYRAGGTGTAGAALEGGAGGAIGVANAATVVTLGDASAALVAQSIGGGGGDGAIVVDGAVAPGPNSITALFGGTSVAGGTGGAVTVTNHGDLGTKGLASDALLAQSIGGGGGTGGFDGTLQTSLGDGAFALVDAGGNADVESTGGTATAINTGVILTMGNGSTGLAAESIGGGGGDADRSLNLTLGTSGAANLAVGAGGVNDYASDGAGVGIANGGAVTTVGYDAFGISAQSIGGGGGNDGFVARGSLTRGGTAPQLLVDVGADGGVVDHAGAVGIGNAAKVQTYGDGSSAIVAQSIGAGGGNSDLAFIGSFSKGTPDEAVAFVGGTGDVSGNGANVTVLNAGDVLTGAVTNGSTSGEFADGILAQSIGGGGGTGGLAIGLGVPTGTPVTGLIGEQLGGSGGISGNATSSTGTGAAVVLGDTGLVETMDGGANGLEAQSIGGGGGNANVDVFGTATLEEGQAAAKFGIVSLVGGTGGVENSGGTVRLVHAGGVVATFGDAADGLLAQSIGGGGGDGGSAHAIAGGATDCSTSSATCSAQLTRLIVEVGGTGAGQGNDGGAVGVGNAGAIQTAGEDADAIVAQSIGGGGGLGGDDHAPGGSQLDEWALAVGGRNNAQGSGNTVTVRDGGGILTMGDGSHGILAQSIGGGGGEAGAGVLGGKGILVLGGSSGAGGNGGTVNVTVANGTIETQGNGAFGILAQSVGGGGGVAGDLDFGINKTTIGSGSSLTASGGGYGNGGDVTVNNTANVETLGTGSDAIFAQSVGGGGGLAGATAAGGQSFAGSAGAGGNAGTVNVTETGIIATTGNGADAIFAQSAAGGTGTGGAVNVTLNGEALAYGTNADGITAQSSGGAGSGNVAVTVAAGSIVQGGAGAGSSAVRILGTGTNTLTNFGTITTAATPVTYPFDAMRSTGATTATAPAAAAPFDFARYAAALQTEGTLMTGAPAQLAALMTDRNFANGGQAAAVTAGGGTLVLDNYGSIYGSIVLDGTALDFVNDGTYVPGANLDLGRGTLALAAGSAMTPGGGGFVATTNVIGNFVQAAGSAYLVTVDLGKNSASAFNVSGTANVGGTVDLDLLDISAPTPGQHAADIITAAGGVTNAGITLTTPNSAVATFTLGVNPTAVQLDYNVNYAPLTGGVLDTNDVALGGYLGRIAAGGGSANFNALMKTVFVIPTVPELKSFYDQLIPAGSAALSSAALLANLDFSNAMLACHDMNGFATSGNCSWGSFGASGGAGSATFGSVGYQQQTTGLATGFQRASSSGHTSFGAAIRYDTGSLTDDAGGTSFSGSGVTAGLSLRRTTDGGMTYSASLIGGGSSYASTRAIAYPTPTTTATGNQSLWYAGAHLRAERTVYRTVTTSVTPFFDIGATRVATGALDESGAGIFDAHIAPTAQLFPTLQSGVSVETTRAIGPNRVRAGLDFSILQLLGSAQTSTTGTLAGAPASVAPFTLSNAIGRTQFAVGPSLEVMNAKRFSIRLSGGYDFSTVSHSLGGNFQIGTRM